MGTSVPGTGTVYVAIYRCVTRSDRKLRKYLTGNIYTLLDYILLRWFHLKQISREVKIIILAAGKPFSAPGQLTPNSGGNNNNFLDCTKFMWSAQNADRCTKCRL